MTMFAIILIGGLLGSGIGYFGQCSSGTCPLTSTWWRGGLYGAFMGLVVSMALGHGRPSAAQHADTNMKTIEEKEFESEAMQAAGPVVVDVFAPWCGPCRTLGPMLDELAGPLKGRVKFLKINVDNAPTVAGRFQITGVPTILFLKDGKVVDTVVGLPSRSQLKARLEQFAQSSPAQPPKSPPEA